MLKHFYNWDGSLLGMTMRAETRTSVYGSGGEYLGTDDQDGTFAGNGERIASSGLFGMLFDRDEK